MGIHPRNQNLITDRLLRSWVRCKRKAWLDQFADQSQRVWSPHKTLQLDHEHSSFKKFLTKTPGKGIET